VARAVRQGRTALFLISVLILARAVTAGFLPLSADEAYYWLWSKYPALGYYDHPPMVAFLIRMGTALFGDTEFGVRFAGALLSMVTSLFIWLAARDILKDEHRAALAALLFNLMLMTGVEMLALTPDTPSIAAAAALLSCLARIQSTGKGVWWLWAGMAAGLGLLSKYSGLFAGVGALYWLIANPRARNWIATPWPWAGGALALLVFLPNLFWQSQHQWMTFAFQFGRVTQGHLTLRFLVEFAGAELGLATPFVLILAVLGAWRIPGREDDRFLLLALIAPALIYFLVHALHDRVQGNWPCFLYPILAILAADAFEPGRGFRGWCSRLAMPVAALVLLLAYAQALTGFLPIRQDPLARLLGVGVRQLAADVEKEKRAMGARAVLASDYETTAWLRFYAPGLSIIAVDQPNRYLDAPRVRLETGPWLYLADQARGRNGTVTGAFAVAARSGSLTRARKDVIIARYDVWRLDRPTLAVPGSKP
jgi:4-amino-4-deoxy-L-arabinose transferase-like glycosyltransferase